MVNINPKIKTQYHCIKCTGFEIIMASISITAVKALKKKEKKNHGETWITLNFVGI
jgi:hypothetical protein